MLSTIFISLPIFIIILAGWFFQRSKFMQGDWVHQANAFAYYVALPALITVSLWDVNFRSPEILQLTLLSIASMVAFLVVLFIILSSITMARDTKAAIFLTAATGNTLYMGIALVEAGFGRDYVPTAALIGNVYLIVPLVLSMLVVRYWHTKDHGIREELMAFFKNPLVLSMVLGVVLSFIAITGNPLIESIKKAMTMLGSTSSPVALFALGGFLYGKFLKKDLHMVMMITGLKMAVFPLIVFFTYQYFGKGEQGELPVLLASMPVAVTTFVIAEKFKMNTALVGNAIVFATVVSFITAPIILVLFK
ncbi:TPA: hypothetical protein DCS99_03740 [Candidatus Wolfebacteria bacterium]|nr:hypothetical protein [Candidatus Wolfebacteria bacterium]